MTLIVRLLAVVWFIQIVVAHTCPGGKSVCPDTATCCLVDIGTYGCCPMKDAVCCNDRTHCCPHATKCDLEHEQCLKDNGESVKMQLKVKAALLDDKIICPDDRWKCPVNDTCCKVGAGKYGCCPIINAVCCADQKHCCPENTECDESEGGCILQGGILVPWKEKQAAQLTKATFLKRAIKNTQSLRICESGKGTCTSFHTCCEGANGESRCCPFRNGVCCQGVDYCCPEGYRCEKEDRTCVEEGKTFFNSKFWTRTFVSFKIHDNEDFLKCGVDTVCPRHDTCCMKENSSEIFTCCPLKQGKCCGTSCCPEGYRCVEGHKCEKLV